MSPKQIRMTLLGVVLVAAAAIAFVFVAAPTTQPDPQLSLTGPDDGVVLDAAGLEEAGFEATVDRADALPEVQLLLDGEDITASAEASDRGLRWDPVGLDDGDYEIVATLDEQVHTRTFRIDTTPPSLSVEGSEGPLVGDDPFVISGEVDDPTAEVRVGDQVADVVDGSFTVEVTPTEVGTTHTIAAVDEAGNASTAEAVEPVSVRSRVRPDTVRAVQASFQGWATPSKKNPVMDMIADGLITSVQLDIKDESGTVGYASQVPLANESGAVNNIYDLEASIAELHDLGVHVSGRIVAFRDPILARWSWDNGERDRVIQTTDGTMYTGRYGGFTNFANPEVRQYNIDLAVEAAKLGVDDILWDYVRRPDGRVSQFSFPGLGEDVTPEEAVAEFVEKADEALAPYGVEHGASLYGIAADRPREIAQDVDLLAPHLDYVAPMLYPSHWGPGEYGVANPNAQPYDIIFRSMQLWTEKVDGTRARVVPWLQDFSMGHPYGPAEVRAQIDAAADVGVDEWMLWNAGMNYTPEALPPVSSDAAGG